MKVLKRAFAVTLVIIMTLSLMPMIPLSQDTTSYAADADQTETENSQADTSSKEYVAEGTWGTCPWHITKNGTLYIGDGKGESFPGHSSKGQYDMPYPWTPYTNQIKRIDSGDDIILPEDISFIFRNCIYLTDIDDLSKWNVSNVKKIDGIFSMCRNLSDIVPLSEWDTSNITEMMDVFSGCENLENISSLNKWNVSKVLDFDFMFSGCKKLKTLNGLSNWDVEKAISIFCMFNDCRSLSDISALSKWDVSNIRLMVGVFTRCSSLTDLAALSNWDTSNVDYMDTMFESCSSLKDASAIKDWNTAKVTSMEHMFSECIALEKLDFSNWSIPDRYEGMLGFSSNINSITFGANADHNFIDNNAYLCPQNGIWTRLNGKDSANAEDLMSLKATNATTAGTRKGTWVRTYAPDCEVTFHPNLGTGVMEKQKFSADIPQALNDNKFIRDGYSFYAWSTAPFNDENIGNTLFAGQKIKIGDDLSLYAIWRPIEYTISYDIKDGKAADNKAQYDIDSDTFTLKNPTKDGYTFLGWTGSNGSVPELNVSIPKGSTGDKSYVANWRPDTVNIYFDGNNAASGSNDPLVVNYGESIVIPDCGFTRKDYQFTGWNTEKNGSGTTFSLGEYKGEWPSEDKITLYAQWQKIQPLQYKLQYMTDGGSAIPSETFDEGKTVDLSSKIPKREGYTFTGWYSDINLTDKITSVKMDTDRNVYAGWKKDSAQGGQPGDTTYNPPGRPSASVKYELTYDTNGGSAVASEKLEKNTTVDLSSRTSTREGYTFVGWYSDKDLKNRVTSVKMTSDQKVYAGWKQNAQNTDATIPDLEMEEHFAYIAGYEDGTFRPDNKITREETASMIYRVLKSDVRKDNYLVNNGFADTTGNEWSNDAISTLSNMRIIKGKPGNRFAPKDNITRAEFVSIITRFIENDNVSSDAQVDFYDINGHWAKKDIKKAASLGWITGRGDGAFHPDDPITRAEAVTILNKVLNRVPSSIYHLENASEWKDNQNTNAWYYIAIQEASYSHEYNREGLTAPDERWTKVTKN